MPDDPKKTKRNGGGEGEAGGAANAAPSREGNGAAPDGNGPDRRALWAEMSEDVSLGSPAAESRTVRAETRPAPTPAVPPVDLDALDPPPAATVVLVRPRDGVPFEVFLVRRHAKSAFLANAYVYPGGRVEPNDTAPDLVRYCRALEPSEMARRLGLSHEGLALGYYVAAIREVYEEAGALAATEGDGKPLDLANPDERDRYETYREILVDDEVDFNQVVGWEDLQLRVDGLVFFAHWVTPKLESKRYDTRFFLLRAPAGQELSHDERETTDGRWVTPAEALEAYAQKQLELAPPTLMTLRDLAQFHSIDEAFEHYAGRAITRIEPHPSLDEEGRLLLLLPGDPDYPETVDRPADGPTRILLAEGHWWVLETGPGDRTVH